MYKINFMGGNGYIFSMVSLGSTSMYEGSAHLLNTDCKNSHGDELAKGC